MKLSGMAAMACLRAWGLLPLLISGAYAAENMVVSPDGPSISKTLPDLSNIGCVHGRNALFGVETC